MRGRLTPVQALLRRNPSDVGRQFLHGRPQSLQARAYRGYPGRIEGAEAKASPPPGPPSAHDGTPPGGEYRAGEGRAQGDHFDGSLLHRYRARARQLNVLTGAVQPAIDDLEAFVNRVIVERVAVPSPGRLSRGQEYVSRSRSRWRRSPVAQWLLGTFTLNQRDLAAAEAASSKAIELDLALIRWLHEAGSILWCLSPP